MKLRSNKGFSLVELIIVIAILGIIAVIAVPNLTGIQQRSQVNADIRTAEAIAKSLTIACAEGRIVTHDSSSKTLEAALSTGWFELGDLGDTGITGINFGEYIDTSIKPKASSADDASFYVRAVPAKETGDSAFNRIVVIVAKSDETISTISDLPYDGALVDGIAEIACINGLELTPANADNYNS